MSDLKHPEILTVERHRPGHRRRFTAGEKQRFLQEAQLPGESMSSVSRRYGITPSLMFRWRQLQDAGALEGLHAEERVVPESEVKQLKARIRELERAVGKKTMESNRPAIDLCRVAA